MSDLYGQVLAVRFLRFGGLLTPLLQSEITTFHPLANNINQSGSHA